MKTKAITKEILRNAIRGLFNCENFILITDKKYFQLGEDSEIIDCLVNAARKNENLIEIYNSATVESEKERIEGNDDSRL